MYSVYVCSYYYMCANTTIYMCGRAAGNRLTACCWLCSQNFLLRALPPPLLRASTQTSSSSSSSVSLLAGDPSCVVN